MKTIEAFRIRKLDQTRAMFKTPHQWGNIDQEMAAFLADMMFIDERFGAWEAEKKRLSSLGRYSVFGVFGPLHWHLPRPASKLGKFSRFPVESASVYAEVLQRLGYLKVERLLTRSEFGMVQALLHAFKGRPTRQADIVERFGPPSITVGGRGHATQCYGPLDKSLSDKGWIFFDYEFQPLAYPDVLRAPPDPETGRTFETITINGLSPEEHPDALNPLLRNIRVPTATFEQGVLLTEYGNRIRFSAYDR